MKRKLQDIAISMLCNCLNNNISIDVEWIPRSKNDQADFISRIVDYDDWGVSDEIFIHLDSLWGPHEIDWCFIPVNGQSMLLVSMRLQLNGMELTNGLYHQFVLYQEFFDT